MPRIFDNIELELLSALRSIGAAASIGHWISRPGRHGRPPARGRETCSGDRNRRTARAADCVFVGTGLHECARINTNEIGTDSREFADRNLQELI